MKPINPSNSTTGTNTDTQKGTGANAGYDKNKDNTRLGGGQTPTTPNNKPGQQAPQQKPGQGGQGTTKR